MGKTMRLRRISNDKNLFLNKNLPSVSSINLTIVVTGQLNIFVSSLVNRNFSFNK